MYYMTEGQPSEIETLNGIDVEDYLKMVSLWQKKIKATTPKKT